MRINIYLVSRTDPVDWNQYDAFVVSAENELEAVEMLNNKHQSKDEKSQLYVHWPRKIELEVKLLGKAVGEYAREPREILGSFIAG